MRLAARLLQIDRLPLTLNDAFSYLPGCLVFLCLFVRVVQLLQASAAVGRMGRFITTVQALVADAVTVTIAGLLVDDVRDLGGQNVSLLLHWRLEVLSPELLGRQDRSQLFALRRGAW